MNEFKQLGQQIDTEDSSLLLDWLKANKGRTLKVQSVAGKSIILVVDGIAEVDQTRPLTCDTPMQDKATLRETREKVNEIIEVLNG